MTSAMKEIHAIEVAPVEHTRSGSACVACALTAYPDFGSWMVVGEGVVRGQCFQADMWRYVFIGCGGMRYLDVTTEYLVTAPDGHNSALRKLVSSA